MFRAPPPGRCRAAVLDLRRVLSDQVVAKELSSVLEEKVGRKRSQNSEPQRLILHVSSNELVEELEIAK